MFIPYNVTGYDCNYLMSTFVASLGISNNFYVVGTYKFSSLYIF